MGLTGPDADAYAKDVVAADFTRHDGGVERLRELLSSARQNTTRAGHIVRRLRNMTPGAKARREPIAVIGMACLLPGASSPEEFWQHLLHDADLRTPGGQDEFGTDPFSAGDEMPDTVGDILAFYEVTSGA